MLILALCNLAEALNGKCSTSASVFVCVCVCVVGVSLVCQDGEIPYANLSVVRGRMVEFQKP